MRVHPQTRFTLPDELNAAEPPEARGLLRDQVKLLVAQGSTMTHSRFDRLGDYMRPGDLLVVNTSEIDFVSSSKDLADLIKEINSMGSGRSTTYRLDLDNLDRDGCQKAIFGERKAALPGRVGLPVWSGRLFLFWGYHGRQDHRTSCP